MVALPVAACKDLTLIRWKKHSLEECVCPWSLIHPSENTAKWGWAEIVSLKLWLWRQNALCLITSILPVKLILACESMTILSCEKPTDRFFQNSSQQWSSKAFDHLTFTQLQVKKHIAHQWGKKSTSFKLPLSLKYEIFYTNVNLCSSYCCSWWKQYITDQNSAALSPKYSKHHRWACWSDLYQMKN